VQERGGIGESGVKEWRCDVVTYSVAYWAEEMWWRRRRVFSGLAKVVASLSR
jgi:hypothetical protein